MNIGYISDLHIDAWLKGTNANSPTVFNHIDTYIESILGDVSLENRLDVLIIAGDIGHYHNQNICLLKKLKMYTDFMIIVHGNHDMYLISNKQRLKYKFNSFKRLQELKDWCNTQEDIFYLDGDVVQIDGITFGGCSLSWDASFLENLTNKQISKEYVINLFKEYMNDSILIFNGHYKNNFDPFKYLEDELEKLNNLKEFPVDVMVSHYSPIVPPQLRPSFSTNPITTFYYFDGKKDAEELNPMCWIFGHTHDEQEFEYNNTKFLCNPLGYPGEKTNRTIKILEII